MSGNFTLICGGDDYLVAREGAAHWEKLCREVEDEYSREIVDGAAGNVADVEKAVAGFTAAVMTMPMFGGKKCVWLRNISFLGDTQTGRSAGARELVEKLLGVLQTINPADVGVLLTACPVDRRRKEFKQLQSLGEVLVTGDEKGSAAAQRIVEEELSAANVRMQPGVLFTFLEKIHANSRMAMEEVRKLALYVGEGGTITIDDVNALVPPFGEGDFFAAVDAFYSLNLETALKGIREHFFGGNDIRPLLTSLQNRARLLLQLRVLSDAGCFGRGVSKAALEQAAARFGSAFPSGGEKSSSNIFTQNPYYLTRLFDTARRLRTRQIIDFQLAFVSAFEQAISRPNEQEEVMRETAVKCLA